MNRPSQYDPHPDADVLSAFTEQALPETDRAQVLAHLAGCAQCREVLFLAQAAAETGAAAAPVVAAKPERPRGWSGSRFPWRIAWIPAAALASIGAVLLWVHVKSAQPVNDARMEPAPMAVPAQPVAPAVANTAQTSAADTALPEARQTAQKARSATGGQESSDERKRKPAGPQTSVIARLEPAPTAPAPPAPQPALSGFAAGNGVALTRQAPARDALAPPPARPPSASQTALANVQWLPSEQASQQVTNASAMAAKAPPVPGPANTLALHGAMTSMGGPQPAALQGAPSMPVLLASQPANAATAGRVLRNLRLPSGLHAVSSAIMLDRALAVDSAGTVFLTHDTGKHWESVRAQWTGKAVQVIGPPPAATGPRPDVGLEISGKPAREAIAAEPPSTESPSVPAAASIVLPATNSPPPPINAGPLPAGTDASSIPPAMVFKLINDHHQMWVSTDGKVWRPQ